MVTQAHILVIAASELIDPLTTERPLVGRVVAIVATEVEEVVVTSHGAGIDHAVMNDKIATLESRESLGPERVRIVLKLKKALRKILS
jgi:hypothetical protein